MTALTKVQTSLLAVGVLAPTGMLETVSVHSCGHPCRMHSTAADISWGQFNNTTFSRKGLFCTITTTIISVRVALEYTAIWFKFRNKLYPAVIAVHFIKLTAFSSGQWLTRAWIATSVINLVFLRSTACNIGQSWAIVVMSVSVKSELLRASSLNWGVVWTRAISPLAVIRSQWRIESFSSWGHFPASAVKPASHISDI